MIRVVATRSQSGVDVLKQDNGVVVHDQHLIDEFNDWFDRASAAPRLRVSGQGNLIDNEGSVVMTPRWVLKEISPSSEHIHYLSTREYQAYAREILVGSIGIDSQTVQKLQEVVRNV